VISVTPEAARHLLELLSEKGLDPGVGGLRLGVEKGGCAGLQYAMTLGGPGPGDAMIEADGARIFVDPASAEHLEGCTLDYEDGLSGSGFRVVNPRATRSCGCGTSFEPARAAQS
jgi:iron-sulfur cluster assembly protein